MSLTQDLRSALRLFRRQPAFAVVAVATLALGVGASTAVFTAYSAVILRPLPFPQAQELVMVLEQNLERGWHWYTVSPANFLDWSEEEGVFEEIAAYSLYTDTGYNLTGGAEPERVVSTAATAAFFDAFGVRPLHGRGFLPGEDTPGRDRVVVIGHGLWQRRFGGDPAVLDQVVQLDGVGHRVVGVMGPDFRYPQDTELWLPLAFDAKERGNRTVRSLFVVARLADGVSLEQAQVRMSAVAGRLEKTYPASNSGFGVVIHALHERVVGGVRAALAVLLAAVGCLLLIACANVANLMLVRAAGRRREMALRQALGAGRGRLVRLLLAEGLVLALAGGLLGLLLAAAGGAALLAAAPAHLPRLDEIRLGGGALCFTLGASLITALVFAAAPVLQLSRLVPARELAAGGRGSSSSGSGLRRLIVVGQVAFALLLLVAAGLTARSLVRLQHQEVGFDPEGLLTLQLALPAVKYPGSEQQELFYRELLERVRAQPGVRAAAVTSWLPFASVTVDWDFHVEGRPPETLVEARTSGFRTVSPGYFETMGVDLRSGRFLQPADRRGSAGVVVINETMARRFWAGEDPVGDRIVLGDLVQHLLPGLPLTAEIVGVVADVKQTALDLPVAPEMFVPYGQYTWDSMYLVVRAAGAPAALAGAVRAEIAAIDPAQPIFDVKTQLQRLADSMAEPRATFLLLAAFALSALVLASVGIYGVLAYSMSQRRREIGVRMALGASRRQVLRWVLVQGMLPALVGLAAGLAAALALTRALRSLLFEISPTDPLTFVAVVLTLLAVSVLACWLPAWRTSRLDPQKALREE